MRRHDENLEDVSKIIANLNLGLDLKDPIKNRLYESRKIAISNMKSKKVGFTNRVKNYIRFIGGGVAILAMSAFVFNYVSFADGKTKVENAYQSFTDKLNFNQNQKTFDSDNKF